VFLLVGRSGSGKSTFTQSLENEIFKNDLFGYIPIWINLTRMTGPINKLT